MLSLFQSSGCNISASFCFALINLMKFKTKQRAIVRTTSVNPTQLEPSIRVEKQKRSNDIGWGFNTRVLSTDLHDSCMCGLWIIVWGDDENNGKQKLCLPSFVRCCFDLVLGFEMKLMTMKCERCERRRCTSSSYIRIFRRSYIIEWKSTHIHCDSYWRLK